MALLQDITTGKNKLKHVRTTCTTADGKQVSYLFPMGCIIDSRGLVAPSTIDQWL